MFAKVRNNEGVGDKNAYVPARLGSAITNAEDERPVKYINIIWRVINNNKMRFIR